MAKTYSEVLKEIKNKTGERPLLNWWNGGKNKKGAWRKKVNGQQKYFFFPNTKAGYQSAVAELESFKNSLNDQREFVAEYKEIQTFFSTCLDWYSLFGVLPSETANKTALQQLLNTINHHLKSTDPLPYPLQLIDEKFPKGKDWHSFYFFFFDSFERLGDEWKINQLWRTRLEQLGNQEIQQAEKLPQTVGFWLDRWIDQIDKQVSGEQRKPRSKQDREEAASKFVDWLGKERHVTQLTSEVLQDWYNHLLTLELASSTKDKRFKMAKRFVKYCWIEEACDLAELPRKIEDRSLTFSKTRSEKKQERAKKADGLWTVQDVQQAYKSCEPRYRAYVLLMLNCGFLATDLNDLEWDEIDLKEGRIVRERSKTGARNVPVVNYKLWDQTIAALLKAKSDNEKFVFTNRYGGRLVSWKGKSYVNLISQNWNKRRADFGLEGKELKMLRHTASTLIDQSGLFRERLESFFLGHAGSSVADRHYNVYSGDVYKPLDEAVSWLGSQFGFTTT